MSYSLRSKAVVGITGIFFAASLATGDAHAVTGRSKPPFSKSDFVTQPVSKPAPGICAQRLSASAARSFGFSQPRILARASALAATMEKQGKDAEPIRAIALASQETGVDFDLLVMKAIIESQLGTFDEPLLGGNARGLFHFMPATWLVMMHRHGDKYRDGLYAPLIAHIRFEGKEPMVDNPDVKEKLLALRSDLYIAAFIKAQEIIHDERPVLRSILGREPNYTDYYVTHFLGIPRADLFFDLMRKSPRKPAATIFDRESADRNNNPAFYNGRKMLSVRQVYDRLDRIITRVLDRIDDWADAGMKAGCLTPLVLAIPDRTAPSVPEPFPYIPLEPESDQPDMEDPPSPADYPDSIRMYIF